MTGLEITLFILGTAFIIISFFIVENSERTPKETAASALDADSFEQLRTDFVEQTSKKADIILHEAEDKLEGLSNDKIIAVGEYSDQVLEKISGNHKEVVFLYQMLNEKEDELKNAVLGMDNARIEVERLMKEIQLAQQKQAEAEARLEAETARFNSRVSEERVQGINASVNLSVPASAGKTIDGGETSDNSNSDAVTNFPVGGQFDFEQASDLEAGYGIGVAENSSSEPVKPKSTRKTPAGSTQVASTKTTKSAQNIAVKPVQGTSAKSAQNNSVKSSSGTAGKPAQGTNVRRTSASGAVKSVPQRSTENLDTSSLSRNDEIIALHKSGKSVMEISKLLGMGQGEVKLIIDLYC